MFVRGVTLHDFRSWDHVHIDLAAEPTIFVGHNGFGKTNLLEALFYLSTLRSHRVSSDAPLIRTGADEAKISAVVENSGRELGVELVLSSKASNRAVLNGSPRRRSRDVLGVLRSVLFAPEDLALVRGEPAERRRFLDELAASRRPLAAAARSDYDRVLRQRSALLKTAAAVMRRGGGDAESVISTLDVWDGQLATYGAAVIASRLKLVAALGPHMSRAYETIAPASRPASLRYRSSVDEELGTPGMEVDAATIEPVMLERLAAVRAKEIERGVCLIGPHRDDLDIVLGNEIGKGFASHGESWSLALALRLGSVELMREDGVEPVVMLDDVFAELDTARRDKLAAFAQSTEQLLITAAVVEDLPSSIGGRQFAVGVREGEGPGLPRTSYLSEQSRRVA